MRFSRVFKDLIGWFERALMVRLGPIAGLLAALILSSGAAHSDEPRHTIDLSNPRDVAEVMQDWGYRAEVSTEGGHTTIFSGTNGDFFFIDFFWCEGQKACGALMFFIEYRVDGGLSLDLANEWNSRWLLGRMNLTENCDVEVSHFVITGTEVPTSVFSDLLSQRSAVVGDLQDFLDEADEIGAGKVATCGGVNVPT